MSVFMTHPLHGANNVASSDVAAQEANGWTVSTYEKWMALAGKSETKIEICDNQPDEPTAKKRGRPFKAQ